MEKQNILNIAKGALMERVDYEMGKIVDNILDLNTKATSKRTLTVTLTLSPDDSREIITVDSMVKSKLEPTMPIKTAMAITPDEKGIVSAVELTAQVPGQQKLDGTEEQPQSFNLFKVANAK